MLNILLLAIILLNLVTLYKNIILIISDYVVFNFLRKILVLVVDFFFVTFLLFILTNIALILN